VSTPQGCKVRGGDRKNGYFFGEKREKEFVRKPEQAIGCKKKKENIGLETEEWGEKKGGPGEAAWGKGRPNMKRERGDGRRIGRRARVRADRGA